jgi:hypothetical protein
MGPMTSTFQKFLKQFHATGYEKADGYDQSHFDGMTEDERQKAFELLKQSLINNNDHTAAFGIAYLNPIEAIPLFESVLSKHPDYASRYIEILKWLWKLSGRIDYLKRVAQTMTNDPDHLYRRKSMTAVEDAPNYCFILDALKESLFVEMNRANQVKAADQLLIRYGVGANERDQLRSQLCSSSPKPRRAGISYLDHFYPINCVKED